MNVLVTGTSGFVGSALVPALRATGHDPITTSTRVFLQRSVFGGAGAIVHLAADTDAAGNFRVNVWGTAGVVDAAPAGARIIFASALTAGCPHDRYDREKALGEQIVCARRDTSAVILRLGNVYGPGPQSPRCVLNSLMRQAVRGETLHVYGNARGCRDYVHVTDVVRAFLLALEAPPGTYDVGTAEATTLAAAAYAIVRQTGAPLEMAPDAHAQHHAMAREDRWLPGWVPTVRLEDGIASTLAWLRKHEVSA